MSPSTYRTVIAPTSCNLLERPEGGFNGVVSYNLERNDLIGYIPDHAKELRVSWSLFNESYTAINTLPCVEIVFQITTPMQNNFFMPQT